MSWYAETPALRLRQQLHDLFVVVWALVWLRVGVAVHEAVQRLAAPGRALERAGRDLSDGLGGAADRADDVPLLGDDLSAPLDSASGAGSALAEAGQVQQDAVGLLALVLTLVVAGLPVLVVVLFQVEVDWTAARVGLLVLAPLSGAVIFGSLFVAAGAVSFWLLDGREVGNALTYGSGYLAQWPTGVLGPVLGRFFTFVVPAAFTGYLPALALLGRENPAGLPDWLPWASPLAALLSAAAAGLLWRTGVRHYVGAGG